jgi:steroid 5-alpha reductase family enzyme
MNTSVMLASAIAIAVLMFGTWLVSLPLKNASIVDPIWPLGFVIVGWVAAFAGHSGRSTTDTERVVALVAMVSIWGLRLSFHLFRRNIGHGEDFRYRAMRKNIGPRFGLVSLVTVFALQGTLMFIVSLPLQFGAGIHHHDAFAWVLLPFGLLVWITGFLFEAVGDAQLRAFKADPASAGQVMDRGLWRYTRHPNYFGDSCVWFGIFLVAASAGGWAWLGIVSPIVMTYFLRFVSGVTMLERSMVKRRPGYADYMRRTSAFLPRPPRT